MPAYFDMGFVVIEASWHRGETTVFQEYPGREEAFIAAGHDFEVVEVFNGWEGGIIDPATFNGPYVKTMGPDGPEYRSYRRQDSEKGLRIRQIRDGAPGPLHGKDIRTVNKTYEPVQNSEPWDILDAVLQDEAINADLALQYETGGVTDGGAQCYVTAKMNKPFVIDGDDSAVYPYVFGTWRHDAQGGITFGGASTRIVCSNTAGMARGEAERANRMFSVKHTKNVRERLNDIKMALLGIYAEHNEFHALAQELAQIELTEEQRKEAIETFIPMPASLLTVEGEASVRQVNNIDRARASVMSAFNSRTIPEAHRLTGWGVYNAMTQYLDHGRPTRGGASILDEKYIESHIKRQINPNRAKDAIPAIIRSAAGVAV